MTRDELFANAKAKREEEKEKDSQRQNFDFEKITWGAMKNKRLKAIRILGNPSSVRDDDPTSAKEILYSYILGDDDKKFRCIWPFKDDDETWILWKILRRYRDLGSTCI